MKIALVLLFTALLARAAGLKEELVAHAGTRFRVVRMEPSRLQLVWKDLQGEPYRGFDRVQANFASQGKKVIFITNAGIFEPGGIPSGVHAESDAMLRPVNHAEGKGNFFLKPNGIVSAGAEGTAFVGSPDAWGKWKARQASITFAAQSGPLLLIAGKRHPAFNQGSANKLLRNGVGIDSKGRFVFAITAKGELVNFWDFAGLFLHLDCQDALFLDGDISQMAVNPPRPVQSNLFAAMFVVAE